MNIYYNMTDLINKTIDELIEYCKEKNIYKYKYIIQ